MTDNQTSNKNTTANRLSEIVLLFETQKNKLEEQEKLIENHAAERKKYIDDLEKTKTDLEKTKSDLEKTKSELEKTKSELEKTKSELEKKTGSEQQVDFNSQMEKYRSQIVTERKIDRDFCVFYNTQSVENCSYIRSNLIPFIQYSSVPKSATLEKDINYTNYHIFHNDKIRLFDSEKNSISNWNYPNPIFNLPAKFIIFGNFTAYSYGTIGLDALIYMEIVNGIDAKIWFMTPEKHYNINYDDNIFQDHNKLNNFMMLHDIAVMHNKTIIGKMKETFDGFMKSVT
jgi:hypothetical protein